MHFDSCFRRIVCVAICCAASLSSAGALPESPPPNLPGATPPIANQVLAHDIFRDLVVVSLATL